ncbi:metalloprotease like protein [Zymoseptoria brevis]|uniref:Metalloprotease like protein n=1 Tax=Zymoseptoria brevis TaxID=1047168 RepID=A0A0F4GLI8_9PEZI|nr:metalloprotease like protein [Zymoseptoria brevis]
MRILIGILIAHLAVLCSAIQRCAAPAPPPELAKNMTDRTVERGMLKNFTVDTYVHVITTQAKKNRYPKAIVEQQMKIMNEKFAPFSFQFRTNDINYTVSDRWATFNGIKKHSAKADPVLAQVEEEFKTMLHKGNYSTLNIYVLSDMEWAYGSAATPLVTPTPMEVIADGIMLSAETMPGGEAVNKYGVYNLGYTAIHETGHWLGLNHVFSEKRTGSSVPFCGDSGDNVDDTPAQITPTRGCPKKKDSCPQQPGKDSIHNYMDYSADSCMTEFTWGQKMKMEQSFAEYRKGR